MNRQTRIYLCFLSPRGAPAGPLGADDVVQRGHEVRVRRHGGGKRPRGVHRQSVARRVGGRRAGDNEKVSGSQFRSDRRRWRTPGDRFVESGGRPVPGDGPSPRGSWTDLRVLHAELVVVPEVEGGGTVDGRRPADPPPGG